ncbi:MAG: hypothetical protein QXE31_04985, partial [Candidatus Woesearchaeota archaeon]
TQVGNYSFGISVWDNSNCQNNYDYREFRLEVINVNDPPILVEHIPNQTIMQDTSISFDLDVYFFDYDNDPLTYTTIPNSLNNIGYFIDSNNVITLTPISGWFGEEEIIFIAWDPYYANATSNIVKIRVMPNQQPQEQQVRGSGGSGSGSSGSMPQCLPQWYCRPFGKCEPDNLRRRECYDLNNCSTNLGKPNLTEPCIFESTCYDGFKGPDEEGVDCGGPCPPCGNCYDNICNNDEDCTKGLIDIPDCGGSCKPCEYGKKESCFDFICNNNEDCTRGLTEIPDCGGPCQPCSYLEQPKKQGVDYGFYFFLFVLSSTLLFLAIKSYPYLLNAMKKRRRKYYEEKLLLEAKISESIFDSILKLEDLIEIENIEKLILMLANIIRRYFKSLFNLRYEFTYEELIDEIKSRRISDTFKSVLINFFERSTEIEFSGKSVSKEEFRAMLSEFKQIVALTSEKELVEKESKVINNPLTKLDEMFFKINQAEILLRQRKINEAYFIYLRLINEYKLLQQSDKRKIHGFIARLYEEIKLAREQYE